MFTIVDLFIGIYFGIFKILMNPLYKLKYLLLIRRYSKV